MRVCAVKGTNVALSALHVALADAVLLLREHDDAAALGRLVGERAELRGVGELLARARPGAGRNAVACRLPSVMVPVLSSSSTSTSPAASTARPLVAMMFAWIIRSMPAMPMAESSPPIVVGMRQTSSATSTVIVTGVPLPAAATLKSENGRSVTVASRKMMVSAASRMSSAISFGRLLPLGALDHRDHPVEERLAGVGRDADDEPVGQHARAAGDGAAVAAALADDRRALAGDGALVDRRDALDDLAVARDRSRPPRRGPGRPCGAATRRRRGRGVARGLGELAWPGCPCAPCAASRPAPCRAPRPSPRRSSRRHGEPEPQRRRRG